MELDVSKGFLKPDEAFPFEAEVVLPPQEVNGETVSFDPVALDMACVDAVNAQTPLRGSAADDAHAKTHVHDHFQRLHPDTNWRSCLGHGEKIGIGTREYELIKI